ncbi:MAG: serine protease [Ferruginibacter sp.]
MNDLLLLEATERYLNNQMSSEERTYFIDLRKNNPDLDALVSEYIFFLETWQKHTDKQSFQKLTANIFQQSVRDGNLVIEQTPVQKGGIVVFWNKHKKTIAVAASIAILVSLISTALQTIFDPVKPKNIQPLIEKINQQDARYRSLENKLGQINQASADSKKPLPRVQGTFRATGFLIDPASKIIITNAHVISEMKKNLVVENLEGEQFETRVLYSDASQDLAILQITDLTYTPPGKNLPFCIRNRKVDLGESVFVLGYPKEEIVYNEGYVSACNGFNLDTSFCQLNIPVNHGNSGSPVLTKNGELIGIISSKQNDSEGVVYASKISNLIKSLRILSDNNTLPALSIPSKSTMGRMDKTIQIKKTSEYVFLITGN